MRVLSVVLCWMVMIIMVFTQGTHACPEPLVPNNGYFTIRIGSQFISLGDLENQKILNLLGRPTSEQIETLQKPPFTGIITKNIKYEGIEIEFSNRLCENKNQFKVERMEITSPNYPTYQGAKVGDGVNELKLTYPKLIDLSNNTYAITAGEVVPWYLTFMTNSKIIEKIIIYAEWP